MLKTISPRGFEIAGPYAIHREQIGRRHWRIYGKRAGVSASVLEPAVDFKFTTRRDAAAYLAKALAQ